MKSERLKSRLIYLDSLPAQNDGSKVGVEIFDPDVYFHFFVDHYYGQKLLIGEAEITKKGLKGNG